jgi:hypothetical protein
MAHPSDEVLIYFFRLLDSGSRLFSNRRKSLSLDSESFAVPSQKIVQVLEDFLGRHGSKLIDISAVGGS